MPVSLSFGVRRFVALAASGALLLGAAACTEPPEPKPLGKEKEVGGSAPGGGADPADPTPTDGGTTPGPGDPTTPLLPPSDGTITGAPEYLPPGKKPPGKPVDVCAIVSAKQIEKSYKLTKVTAKPSSIPPMTVPIYGCSYVSKTDKSAEPLAISIRVTPKTGLTDPKQVVDTYGAGKAKATPGLGDAAGYAPVGTLSGPTDQLFVAQKTDQGLSGIVVEGPPKVGVKPLTAIAKQVLAKL